MTAAAASHSKALRTKENMSILLADLFLTTVASSLTCRHPSIRTHCERLMRSVHIGCSRYSRRCLLKAPSRAIRRWIGGKAKGAVAGTRHLGDIGVPAPCFSSHLCQATSPRSGIVLSILSTSAAVGGIRTHIARKPGILPLDHHRHYRDVLALPRRRSEQRSGGSLFRPQ